MATRINPPLDNTEALVGELLTHVLEGERVAFLVPAGTAFHIMARVRTMISRRRRRVLEANRKPKRFTLHHTCHAETHNGLRMDCIVVWKHVGESHMLTETLEDLISNG